MIQILDQFGIEYVPLTWHYWLGIATVLILNIFIGANIEWHFKAKWLYWAAPIVFSVIVYFAASILMAQLKLEMII